MIELKNCPICGSERFYLYSDDKTKYMLSKVDIQKNTVSPDVGIILEVSFCHNCGFISLCIPKEQLEKINRDLDSENKQ